MNALALYEPEYKRNQTIVKLFGVDDNKKIKVITMNILRNKGVEAHSRFDVMKECFSDEEIQLMRELHENDCKLSENITRAKSKIFELAFCNKWDYFFTATLDPKKYDRTNLEVFHHDLTQWFNNIKKKKGFKVDFLLIPELHTDGKSWHMHGFLYGIPPEELVQFKIGDKMGKKLAEKVKNGDVVFNWPAYQNKFGFCDLEPIRSHEAVSKYMTKYINKNLASSVTELNAHLYYHSRGLQFAEIVKVGRMTAIIQPTYENEYCKISWLPYSEKALNAILDTIVCTD